MKCQICGRQSIPGAKLCLDCKAARKRAFDATVTQPLLAAAGVARGSAASPRLLKPSQSVPRGARRAARLALAAQAQPRTNTETPPPRTSRWPIVIGAICVLALGVGFSAHWFGAGTTETFTTVPTEHSATEAQLATSTARPTAPTAAAPAPASAVPPASRNTADAASVTAGNKPDAPRRPNPKVRTEKAPAPLPVAEPPPPPAVAVAPPPPPVVREVPRADPWQPMNDALARCSANDMSGRLSCEYRVRTQYCEGRWGQVAQCASIPYAEHGG